MFGRKSAGKAKTKTEKKPKPDRKAARAEKQTAKAEAAASRKARVARPAGPLRKQPTDIYTVLMMLSVLAMLVANILMWIELFRYGNWPQWRG